MIGAALQRIAQGAERCGECKRVIAQGEKLWRQTCKQNGEFHILMVCSTCHVPTARERWLERLKKLLPKKNQC